MASTTAFLVLVLATLPFLSTLSEAQAAPPLAKGLSWTFYKSSCPKVESIVRNYLKNAFKKDIGLAAGLLRVHFHDCFVQGCDGSVLLDGSASGPSEKDAPPNLTLRPTAFAAINELRNLLQRRCGRVVSCSDIAALAARDAVELSGGPGYRVPLGRRDGLTFATRETTLEFLPSPFSETPTLLAALAKLNLDANDLVTLSGGHTIGIAHCGSFSNRLYPTQDPVMDKTFAKGLYRTCPTSNTDNTTVLDIRSPNAFDNKYYVDLMNRQGLFTSDQDLYTDSQTKGFVTSFAVDQQLFFERFAFSMVKMGQLSVLTGNQGEIRANCSARNPTSRDESLRTVVAGDGDSAAY
uniref:Peroxidase n=1 Tax=Anthurium amnicola TaxID=1678845 RepID=A0A1D1YNK4_9ARAE